MQASQLQKKVIIKINITTKSIMHDLKFVTHSSKIIVSMDRQAHCRGFFYFQIEFLYTFFLIIQESNNNQITSLSSHSSRKQYFYVGSFECIRNEK